MVLLVESFFCVYFSSLLCFPQLLDMKVFVDTDSDIRLVRRLKRDISERGRDLAGVIKQYNKFVKPAFEQYIEPTVQLADIVVPRGNAHILKGLAVKTKPSAKSSHGISYLLFLSASQFNCIPHNHSLSTERLLT